MQKSKRSNFSSKKGSEMPRSESKDSKNYFIPSKPLETAIKKIKKKFQIFFEILEKFEKKYFTIKNFNYLNYPKSYEETLKSLTETFNKKFYIFLEEILMSNFIENIWEREHPFEMTCNCVKKKSEENHNCGKICKERMKKLDYFNKFYEIIQTVKEKSGMGDWGDCEYINELEIPCCDSSYEEREAFSKGEKGGFGDCYYENYEDCEDLENIGDVNNSFIPRGSDEKGKDRNLDIANLSQNSYIGVTQDNDEVLAGLDNYVLAATRNSTLNTNELLSPRIQISSYKKGGTSDRRDFFKKKEFNNNNIPRNNSGDFGLHLDFKKLKAKNNVENDGKIGEVNKRDSLSPRVLIGEISEGKVRVNHYTRNTLDKEESPKENYDIMDSFGNTTSRRKRRGESTLDYEIEEETKRGKRKRSLISRRLNSKRKSNKSHHQSKKVFNSEYEDSARVDTARAEELFIFGENQKSGNCFSKENSIRRKLDLDVTVEEDEPSQEEEFEEIGDNNSKIVKIKILDENYLSTQGLILKGTETRRKAEDIMRSKKRQEKENYEEIANKEKRTLKEYKSEDEEGDYRNYPSYQQSQNEMSIKRKDISKINKPPSLNLNLLEDPGILDTVEYDELERNGGVKALNLRDLRRESENESVKKITINLKKSSKLDIESDNFHTFKALKTAEEVKQELLEYHDTEILKNTKDSQITFKQDSTSSNVIEGLNSVKCDIRSRDFKEIKDIRCQNLREKRSEKENFDYIITTEREVRTTWRRLDGVKEMFKEKSPVRVIEGNVDPLIAQSLFSNRDPKQRMVFEERRVSRQVRSHRYAGGSSIGFFN